MAYFFSHFYFSFGVVRVPKGDVPHVSETIEYLYSVMSPWSPSFEFCDVTMGGLREGGQ